MLANMRLQMAAVVGAAALLAGCASGPDLHADYDRAADFGKYHTFGFVSQTGTDTEFRSIGMQLMQAAAAKEMEARGYTRSDNPDLVINFKGKLEEKTDIESTPAPYYGPGWGYGGMRGGYWGGGYGTMGSTQVSTRRYNVGTLVMDVVDREKRQAVFQGGIEGVVTKKMMENREAAITGAVQKIFTNYPFVAGQSAPVQAPAKK